jgi:ABC-type nitrate/sulfonate/bicarbonate transport system substrate-binding protein
MIRFLVAVHACRRFAGWACASRSSRRLARRRGTLPLARRLPGWACASRSWRRLARRGGSLPLAQAPARGLARPALAVPRARDTARPTPRLLGAAASVLLLAACGGAAAPASQSAAPATSGAAPASAKPAASAATSAKPAGSAPASAKPAASGGGAKLKVAYAGPFDNMAVMWVAQDGGLFQKYGLDVDLSLISGSPIASAALVSHDVDMVEMSGPAVVNAVTQNTDEVMIAGFENVFIFTLMVDPSIKTIADLKGKTAAVTLVGSEDDSVLRKVLLDNKLKPDDDVHITPVRDPGGQLAAFSSKQAQAVMTGGANIAKLKQVGAVPLIDIGKLRIPFQSAGLVTTRAFVSSRRADALNALKASGEAIHRIKTDEAGTKAIMAKYLKTSDPDVLAASWQADQDYMEDVPAPSLPGFQEILTERKITGHKPEDFVDQSLVRDLDQQGFFASLKKQLPA